MKCKNCKLLKDESWGYSCPHNVFGKTWKPSDSEIEDFKCSDFQPINQELTEVIKQDEND